MEDRSAPARPALAEQAAQFMLLERAVEQEYRPLMLAELQRKVDVVAQAAQSTGPACPCCGQTMRRKDTRPVSWLARFGRLSAPVSRFVCRPCHMSAGRCWTCWAWSLGVSAVLWPDCWRSWRGWPPIHW